MYSFDVFDTLITRNTANPKGIFALMEHRLQKERDINGLEDYVIDNFFELRIQSENLIRKSSSIQQIEEVTLRDIYTAMSVCGCMNEKQIEYLCQLEKETEIANVAGISENIQRLKELLKQGERVILVSDMYLPKETIRQMLLQADDIFSSMEIYVSSEYGRRKTTGNLYRLVQKMEQVSYEDWTHIGDDIYQDIEVPYQLGIRVEQVHKPVPSDFEKKLLDHYGDDSKLQLMVGTAVKMAKGREEADAYCIGCRYAGPMLYSYAEWIVEQAVRKNISRLYFIARDGYLIKQIVDIILDRKQSDILTSYIYGSRKAWRMPSLSEDHYNLYQLLRWSYASRITALDELAAAMHISLRELYEYLPGTYSENKDDTYISGQEVEYIARKLSEDERFKSFHLQKLEAERTLLRQYLAQEIDTTDDSFAFVDVSGGGLTQGCLWELLKDKYPKPIHTFFFKIDRVNLAKGSITDTFIPSFLENNLVIEMMCRAPHGQTDGYRLEKGRVVPILDEAESGPLIRHGFYEYEKGVVDFSRLMCDVSIKTGIKISAIRNVLSYLKYIAEEPSRDVLEYFASMPSSASGRGSMVIEYAPRLTKEEMETLFLLRTDEPIELFYKGTNLNYSIMRVTEEEKALIESYKLGQYGTIGKMYRQEKDRKIKDLRKRYGKAAFYPVRLLEKNIVLYGAGKVGQDLRRRLADDREHTVVLWADKNAAAYQQQGMEEVCDVSEISKVPYDQIVIAVMEKGLADAIRDELRLMGIDRERMIWLPPQRHPNMEAEWNLKGIG